MTKHLSTCIYCRCASESAFHEEHVLPEAFGKFAEPPGLRCVCNDCNQAFGDTLELSLGRDSYLAILRLQHGVKSPVEAKKLRSTRLTMRVDVPGPWFGALVRLRADILGERLIAEPISQIAFQKADKDWEWMTEQSLDKHGIGDERRSPDIRIKIVGPESDQLRLIEKLRKLGVKFKKEEVFEQPLTKDGQIQLLANSQIDEIILRGIGKIAFNYLAYIEGPSYVLREDFDGIRNYVRFGTSPGYNPVTISSRPILMGDSPTLRQARGHVLTIQWEPNAETLLALVSLFNSITYRVAFCNRFRGLWHKIRSGHYFNPRSRRIEELGSTGLILPMAAGRTPRT